MNLGIIISVNDSETCWNAIRYANFALNNNDDVKIFFMGKGVEYREKSNEKFNASVEADKFIKGGGKIYACGTCIKSRNKDASEACPISSMQDMYDIVKESDRVVTF
ncbi:MAG: DsrE family protein [Elusimicrobia bacterium]|jgi:predicted peroxiredoxin|nr:DsrE family protein [Elusimicrobiota bacterium]